MELLANLMAIGLTEYEAKVYMALLRESPANGYQLSKRSGIPRSMVYEALGRLYARGAVLVTEEDRATLYRPLPPDVLLDRYEQEQNRLMRSLRDSLRALNLAEDEERFWLVHGQSAVLSYAAQMIDGADTEVLLVLDDPTLEAMRGHVQAAARRELSVGALLTGRGDLDCGRVAHHPPAESELQELTDTLVVVADGHEALIANTNSETTATITRNRNLVKIARQFVWMELFAQRVYNRLGAQLLAQLEPEDQHIFESFSVP